MTKKFEKARDEAANNKFVCDCDGYNGFIEGANWAYEWCQKEADALADVLREMVEMMDSGDEHGAGNEWHQKAKAVLGDDND